MNEKKSRRVTVDMEKIGLVWIEDQTSCSILLSQSLTQSKALNFFNSLKAEGDEETSEEQFEASKGLFMKL